MVFKNILLSLLLFVSIEALAQNPVPNIGFEDGTFTNWQCFAGTIDTSGVISVPFIGPLSQKHVMFNKQDATTLDHYGKFPVLCPNGSNHSVRLGDLKNGSGAEKMTYTFTVPNVKNYTVIFDYAVVLQDPPHLPFQQPKFTAKVFDVDDGVYINCPSFDFVAGSALPGFKLSDVVDSLGSTSYFYKDWSTASIDLGNYIGKQMTLEFTVNDCTLGAHLGYAYLDVEDNSKVTPITGNSYCLGQKSITLTGPYGFSDYLWYNADFSKQIGKGQSIVISPAPPDLSKYALRVLPYPDLGCVDTLYTTVNKIDEGFKLNVLDTVVGCTGMTADLTAATVTAGSSAGTTFSYFTDSLSNSYLANPNLVAAAGVYYIRGVNTEGCTNILPVRVVFGKPDISVTDPAAVDYPATVDLSKTFTHKTGLVYSYYSDAQATVSVNNYAAIPRSGTYYIKVVNSSGCAIISPVNVIVHPPPPLSIKSPNTFTPNNDGVNDKFSITITGTVAFKSFKIFNRNGQLVFTAKSAGQYWDGNYNGKNLPAGTYYWVFEGDDLYYNKKVSQGSSITLIR